jgi:hypothetical protein
MADEILTPATRYAQTSNLPAGWYTLADMQEAVAAALQRFTDDRPRIAVDGFVGDGTDVYDLSTKVAGGSWDEDTSRVVDVAYPFSAADENLLESEEWHVVELPTVGKSLHIKSGAPAATDYVRVRFTASWTEAAVPARFRSAVAMLAAAAYLRMIAARYAQSGESLLGADAFNRGGAAQTMRSLARDYEDKYAALVVGATGASGDGAAGAAALAPSVVFVSAPLDGQRGAGPLVPYGDDYVE